MTDLSVDEATQIYELRILLEPLCLRQSLEASDDDHRSEIRTAFEVFRSAPTMEQGVEAHARFHAALARAGARRPWLLRFTTQLSAAFTPVPGGIRRRSAGPPPSARPSTERCARPRFDGDVERCVTLQEEHLRRTFALIGGTAHPQR